MRKLVAFFSLLVVALSVFFGVTSRRVGAAAPASSWPLDPREQLAVNGITAFWRSVDDQIAPVITDAQLRAAVISWVHDRSHAIDKAQDDLLHDALSRRGLPPDTAVAFSGATLVTVAPVASVAR